MRLKTCRKCEKDLPLDNFTSTMAKYCEKCKYIFKIEQKHARTIRQLERTKQKKQKEKVGISIPNLKQRAQTIFNKWIRKRDKNDGCISCDSTEASSYDAGHFWPQGSKGALRFHEDNCHKQCRSCNRFKHANLSEYRIRLVKKIGEERLKWLEDHRNDTHKWTRTELIDIINKYGKKMEKNN